MRLKSQSEPGFYIFIDNIEAQIVKISIGTLEKEG